MSKITKTVKHNCQGICRNTEGTREHRTQGGVVKADRTAKWILTIEECLISQTNTDAEIYAIKLKRQNLKQMIR